MMCVASPAHRQDLLGRCFSKRWLQFVFFWLSGNVYGLEGSPGHFPTQKPASLHALITARWGLAEHKHMTACIWSVIKRLGQPSPRPASGGLLAFLHASLKEVSPIRRLGLLHSSAKVSCSHARAASQHPRAHSEAWSLWGCFKARSDQHAFVLLLIQTPARSHILSLAASHAPTNQLPQCSATPLLLPTLLTCDLLCSLMSTHSTCALSEKHHSCPQLVRPLTMTILLTAYLSLKDTAGDLLLSASLLATPHSFPSLSLLSPPRASHAHL